VLVVVLFFALLLTSSVATFLRRATVDSMIARNRESRARADALARGGIELAKALLLEDLLGHGADGAVDSREDIWARVSGNEIALEDGATLRLRIEDSGARLNINAVIGFDDSGSTNDGAEILVAYLLEKVIEEIPVPPGEKFYDVPELVANLIDFVDENELRQRGGGEDDFYQAQDPPYRAPNRPLLSVDELRRVEGFDAKLVDALRPYLTVYPFVGQSGINPNSAPPHVLALLFFNDGVAEVLAPESTVRDILRIREEGGLVCGEAQSDEACTPIGEIVTNANSIYPPPSFTSDVFTVIAEARVGDVRRSIEAVIDRREAPDTLLLSWRVL